MNFGARVALALHDFLTDVHARADSAVRGVPPKSSQCLMRSKKAPGQRIRLACRVYHGAVPSGRVMRSMKFQPPAPWLILTRMRFLPWMS